MSEEQKKTEAANAAAQTNTQPAASGELEALKKRADIMGITYAANVGVETLKEKVNAAILASQEQETGGKASAAANTAAGERSIYDVQHDKHMRLIRIRVANLNPAKANVPGEVITFVNGILGKVSKLIPFGDAGQVGYHVPSILVDELRSRRFLSMKSVKRANGTHEIIRRMVPEYSIEELPPLTKEEIDDLKARQHASGAIE